MKAQRQSKARTAETEHEALPERPRQRTRARADADAAVLPAPPAPRIAPGYAAEAVVAYAPDRQRQSAQAATTVRAALRVPVPGPARLAERQVEHSAEDTAHAHDERAVGQDEQPDIATLLDQATAEPGLELPHRAALEAYVGQPLADVRVYSGPAARRALHALDATAATRGQAILLADAQPGLATLVHEVVHVLQARGSAPAAVATVAAAESAAEREAQRLTDQLPHGASTPAALEDRPLDAAGWHGTEISTAIGMQTVALQRMGAATPTRRAAPPAPAAAMSKAAAAPARTAAGGAARGGTPAGGAAATGAAPARAGAPGVAPAATGAAPAAAQAGAGGAAPATAQATVAGEDVRDLLSSFVSAGPTQQAQMYAGLGAQIGQVASSEEQRFASALPTYEATMQGQTQPSPPLASNAMTPTFAPVAIDVPSAPLEVPHATTPAQPEAAPTLRPPQELRQATSSTERATELGEALREAQAAEHVETSPGPAPAVPQSGASDPTQLDRQADTGKALATTAHEQAATAIREGPGPDQVQPLALREEHTVTGLAESEIAPPAANEGMQTYLAMGMTPDIQATFDQRVQSERQGQLAQAQSQIEQAATTRDQNRQTELDRADQQATTLNQTAERDQNAAVDAQRKRVRDERDLTLKKQQDAVADVERESLDERDRNRTGIDTRVAEDQRKIDGEYQKAETDAKAEAQRGAARADEKRRETERDAKDESWWDRAISFLEDALKAFSEAITAIFDAIRSAVNRIIDAAVAFANRIIDAAVRFINEAIAAFGKLLQDLVQGLLADLFPELAAALCAFINEAVELAQRAVSAIGETLKKGIAAVADALKAGLNAIISAYQAAVEIGMALVEAGLTGDFSALARKLLEAALALAGIDPEAFYGFVGKAEETFQLILDNPGGFVSNLIDSFIGGVQRFAANFGTHLQAGLIGWLTGAIGGAGITLPDRFDLLGVLSIAQQIIGLTWPRIRTEVTRIIGERAVEVIEFVGGYIQTLIEGGWSALFDRIREDLATLADTVLGGIKDFLVERVVVAAITRLATLFNPVGALVQLVLAAWNLYSFLRDKLQQIMGVVQAITESITTIIRGVIDPATARVEGVLGGLLPLAIDLLARLLGLGGVGERVREIIGNVQEAIWKAIRGLIGRVRALFKGGGKGQSAGKERASDAADKRTLKQKEDDLEHGVAAALRLLKQPDATEAGVRDHLPTIQKQYRLTTLKLVVDARQGASETVHILGEVNPSSTTPPVTLSTTTDLKEGDYLGVKISVARSGRRTSTAGAIAGDQWQAVQITKIAAGQVTLRYMSSGSTSQFPLQLVVDDVKTAMTRFKRISGPAELADKGVYVEAGMLKPEFRGSGPIRSKFYFGDYAAAAPTLRAAQARQALAHPSHALGKAGGAGAWGPDAWLCPGFNRPAHIVDEDGQVDHKTSVAEHWSKLGGNNTDQDARRQFNTNTGNLQLLCGPCNTSKGSMSSTGVRVYFTDAVGDNFTGPDDKR